MGSGFYGEVDNAPAGYGQGNSGFSGTPLWKLRQHGLVHGARPPALGLKEEQEQKKQLEELQVANVLVDLASLGAPPLPPAAKGPVRAMVRHVIVKDLRKVATRSKLSLPVSGIFGEQVPVALFAMFDGQSCAEPSSCTGQAAEWCCKHAYIKLIRNLMALPPDQVNRTYVKATLVKTFEDLDHDLLVSQPGITDGCGGVLALLVGSTLFTAALGKCNVVLCEPPASGDGSAAEPEAWRGRALGTNQGRCDLPTEQAWLEQHGGEVVESNGHACLRDQSGAEAAVCRSLGDRKWKVGDASGAGAGLLRCLPEVASVELSFAGASPVMVMTSTPVTENVAVGQIADVVRCFPLKPKAASGDIASCAAEAIAPSKDPAAVAAVNQQCTAISVCFLPPKGAAEDAAGTKAAVTAAEGPAAKKLKTGPAKEAAQNVRLRHILVRHAESTPPHDPVRNKPVVRSLPEAEMALRRALRELQQEQEARAKLRTALDQKKASLANAAPSPKYLALCKELSECESATKGGGMCGDLGWVKPDDLRAFGPAFVEVAKGLGIGQWSDLVLSPQGAHVVQRIA